MKLAKSYQPELFEAKIYKLWEQNGAFSAAAKGEPYSLVVPPPNANGNLHMGHALSFAVQDIAARYHRSKGERVVFIPGADHAGFETQVVYERELEKQGKSRFEYSREALYEQIMNFVLKNRENFQTQIRNLGASVDWNRYTFTLDKSVVKQAYDTFHKMWQEGLIYRGERLVNFCTFHGTAFADIEVEYREEEGKLWQIRYPLSDNSGEIVVATTRPETLFGDTAVAVNPQDKRYLPYVGKTVKLPLSNRVIPVIADDYVDMSYGTGAVKITPAHDQNDFEVAERHDLPRVSVIGFDGKLLHNVPEPLRGLNVEEGRAATVKALADGSFLVKEESLTHNVGHCYKCDSVIEPLLKEQWFVDMKPLAATALEAIRAGKIKFIPDQKRSQLELYLKNIKDWNISRQIVWGIPIPMFVNEEDPGDWIYDERVDQEVIKQGNHTYRRDPDVFDTWFSSSSWPYSTLGFPNSPDFNSFYPLTLMESGFDLLYPWISRMVMLGLYVTKEVPFSTVYLHGMITDKKGRKMSKSVGNVINPMDVIKKYGSDALRIGIILGQSAGSNQPFVEAKVLGGRNFVNKLWNVARFIEGKVENFESGEITITEAVDSWITNRLALTRDDYFKQMDAYRFSEAYETVYRFIWDDLADWYIEANKVGLNQPLLTYLLQAALVLIHPFAPFVSETIWQTLDFKQNSLLIHQQFPEPPTFSAEKAIEFERIKSLIIEIRSLLSTSGAKNVKLYYRNEPIVASFATLINQLSGTKAVEEGEPGQGIALSTSGFSCWLDIDQDAIERYLAKLDQMIASKQQLTTNLRRRLSNPAYLEQAPADLINETRTQLNEAEQTLENLLDEKMRYASH